MARPRTPVGPLPAPAAAPDTRALLLAARGDLEARMKTCGDREYAGLMGQYLKVLDKLDALAGPTEVGVVDELTAARDARRAKAAGQ